MKNLKVSGAIPQLSTQASHVNSGTQFLEQLGTAQEGFGSILSSLQSMKQTEDNERAAVAETEARINKERIDEAKFLRGIKDRNEAKERRDAAEARRLEDERKAKAKEAQELMVNKLTQQALANQISGGPQEALQYLYTQANEAADPVVASAMRTQFVEAAAIQAKEASDAAYDQLPEEHQAQTSKASLYSKSIQETFSAFGISKEFLANSESRALQSILSGQEKSKEDDYKTIKSHREDKLTENRARVIDDLAEVSNKVYAATDFREGAGIQSSVTSIRKNLSSLNVSNGFTVDERTTATKKTFSEGVHIIINSRLTKTQKGTALNNLKDAYLSKESNGDPAVLSSESTWIKNEIVQAKAKASEISLSTQIKQKYNYNYIRNQLQKNGGVLDNTITEGSQNGTDVNIFDLGEAVSSEKLSKTQASDIGAAVRKGVERRERIVGISGAYEKELAGVSVEYAKWSKEDRTFFVTNQVTEYLEKGDLASVAQIVELGVSSGVPGEAISRLLTNAINIDSPNYNETRDNARAFIEAYDELPPEHQSIISGSLSDATSGWLSDQRAAVKSLGDDHTLSDRTEFLERKPFPFDKADELVAALVKEHSGNHAAVFGYFGKATDDDVEDNLAVHIETILSEVREKHPRASAEQIREHTSEKVRSDMRFNGDQWLRLPPNVHRGGVRDLSRISKKIPENMDIIASLAHTLSKDEFYTKDLSEENLGKAQSAARTLARIVLDEDVIIDQDASGGALRFKYTNHDGRTNIVTYPDGEEVVFDSELIYEVSSYIEAVGMSNIKSDLRWLALKSL